MKRKTVRHAKKRGISSGERECLRTVRRMGADEVVLAAENELERKLLNTSGAVVVKFWDGKPHLAEEAFGRVAKKYANDVKFACVRVKDRKTVRRYAIMHSPTFVFFEDGREKSRISGITPKEALDVWCEMNK